MDFVWKWAPNGNPKERNFKFQTEYFTRDEDGTFDPASSGTPLAYRGKQNGWYAQGYTNSCRAGALGYATTSSNPMP